MLTTKTISRISLIVKYINIELHYFKLITITIELNIGRSIRVD